MIGDILGWIWILTGEKSLLIVAAVIFAMSAIVNDR